jgi:hypothetical protein
MPADQAACVTLLQLVLPWWHWVHLLAWMHPCHHMLLPWVVML